MITYQFFGKTFVIGSAGFSPKPQYPKKPDNITNEQTIVIPVRNIIQMIFPRGSGISSTNVIIDIKKLLKFPNFSSTLPIIITRGIKLGRAIEFSIGSVTPTPSILNMQTPINFITPPKLFIGFVSVSGYSILFLTPKETHERTTSTVNKHFS